MKSIGKFILPGRAKGLIAAYVKQLSRPESECTIGHLFSLDRIRELMSYIDDYNLKPGRTEDEKIGGIRIYHGMDTGRQSSDKSDLFIMPVKNNGKDLYDIYPLKMDEKDAANDGGVLGEPKPCPNYC